MANQKITQLTELTTLALDDLFAVVDDPAGMPITKKLELATLLGELTGGWIDYSDALTYASATTFTIAGDVTKIFRKRRAISFVQTATKYFYVVSSIYSAPNTTVTVTGGGVYTVANAAISSVKIGITDNPLDFPWSGGFVPLTTPLTSTSFDGDSFSSTAKTLIDLSAVFGVPAGVKAVYVWTAVRDSGSAAGDANLMLGPDNVSGNGVGADCSGQTNDSWERTTCIVPCNSDGDIYYQISATGASTMDVFIRVWGYYI